MRTTKKEFKSLEERAREVGLKLKLFSGNSKISTETDIVKQVVILDALIEVRRETILALTLRLSASIAAEVRKILEEKPL